MLTTMRIVRKNASLAGPILLFHCIVTPQEDSASLVSILPAVPWTCTILLPLLSLYSQTVWHLDQQYPKTWYCCSFSTCICHCHKCSNRIIIIILIMMDTLF